VRGHFQMRGERVPPQSKSCDPLAASDALLELVDRPEQIDERSLERRDGRADRAVCILGCHPGPAAFAALIRHGIITSAIWPLPGQYGAGSVRRRLISMCGARAIPRMTRVRDQPASSTARSHTDVGRSRNCQHDADQASRDQHRALRLPPILPREMAGPRFTRKMLPNADAAGSVSRRCDELKRLCLTESSPAHPGITAPAAPALPDSAAVGAAALLRPAWWVSPSALRRSPAGATRTRL
jgi:hypothetical protein